MYERVFHIVWSLVGLVALVTVVLVAIAVSRVIQLATHLTKSGILEQLLEALTSRGALN